MSKKLNNNQEINDLVHQAYRAYLKENALYAIELLNKAISIRKSQELPSSSHVWAHAYKGEILLSMAQKMNPFTNHKTRFLSESLMHFNAALGIEGDSEIGIDDQDKNYNHWIVAHRGEVLRVMGNEMIADSSRRSEYYEGAIECFKIATEKDPTYAWAYAHWGATLSNQRGKNDEYYKEALALLDCALILSEYHYPWAYAYKAITYLQMQERKWHEYAFYDFVFAIRQDASLIYQSLQPPAAFDQDLNEQQQYLEAIWAYEQALEYRPRDHRQLLYIHYYRFIYRKYIPTSYGKSNRHIPDKKLRFDLVWDGYDNFSRYQKLSKADKYYIQGGMIALYFTDLMQTPEKEREDFWQLDGEKRRKFLSVDIKVDSVKIKKDLSILIEKAKSISQRDHIYMQTMLELCLSLLSHSICEADKTKRGDEYRRMARQDMAWYHLRKGPEFKSIVSLNNVTKNNIS